MGEKIKALGIKIKRFKELPKKGLSSFVDFSKRASLEAQRLIKNLVTKNKKSQQEVAEAAKYSIAKQFVDMYESRYGKKFIQNFITFFSDIKAQEFVLDHVSLEAQKILVSEVDTDIIKRKYRADGIMIVPKVAEKLEIYMITVAQYEAKQAKEKQSLDEGAEIFGKQTIED